jgi:hypothetical protein
MCSVVIYIIFLIHQNLTVIAETSITGSMNNTISWPTGQNWAWSHKHRDFFNLFSLKCAIKIKFSKKNSYQFMWLLLCRALYIQRKMYFYKFQLNCWIGLDYHLYIALHYSICRDYLPSKFFFFNIYNSKQFEQEVSFHYNAQNGNVLFYSETHTLYLHFTRAKK